MRRGMRNESRIGGEGIEIGREREESAKKRRMSALNNFFFLLFYFTGHGKITRRREK